MDAITQLMTHRERFEARKRVIDAVPTDPAQALVRATNEQTLALYLLGTLLAEFIGGHRLDLLTTPPHSTDFPYTYNEDQS